MTTGTQWCRPATWRIGAVWSAALIMAALGLSAGAAIAGEDPFDALGLQRFSRPLPAPDFTLKDLVDNPVSLSHLRGRVVFLNFWATWCPPCREEMPSMERLHQTFKGRGLLVLAVNLQESPNLVRKFTRNFGLTFPILLDETGEVSSAYGARAIPVTYLIDTNGSIAARAVGARDWASPAALGLIEKLAANAR